MDPHDRPYTSHVIVDGMRVIGFVDRGSEGLSSDTSYDRDVAEFKRRMEGLGKDGHPEFVVVDFSNYRMTDCDNGRAVVGFVLGAHRRLKAQGGGLLVCHHPVQLNPDLQHAFHLDNVIDLYRSRPEALDAARSRTM